MKPVRLIMLLSLILVASFVLVGVAQGSTNNSGSLYPEDLAIYYGWPSLVNGISNDNAAAAAVFGQYDVVVFNQSLEELDHLDHANTQEIIQLLQNAYGTRVFGYLDGPQWGTSWSWTGMAPVDWSSHADYWNAMGVDGIFIDRFGYDWGVTRVNQNAMLDVVHDRGLPAFVNSWFIDHAFSNQPDSNFTSGNPGSVPTKLEPTDLYLLESFTIIEGDYDQCDRDSFDAWPDKAGKAVAYHDTFGTTMWTMTTADSLNTPGSNPADIEEKLSFAWHATAMYGLDGFSWAESQFSASGPFQNLLPWRPRPNPNQPDGIGIAFFEDVQQGGDYFSRRTTTGEFQMTCNDDTTTYLADFVAETCEAARYDFDGNGEINIVDVGMVASRWEDPANYDVLFDVSPITGPDSVINIVDVAAMAARFGMTCP